MTDPFSFAITGIPELDRKFESLTSSIQRRGLRRGVHRGAMKLRTEIGRKAPKSRKTGTTWKISARQTGKLARNAAQLKRGALPLRNTISIRPSSNWRSRADAARKGIIGATVSATFPYGAHVHLLEFGHALVAWGRRTSQRVKPFPFMRPAMDASQSAVFAAMQSELAKQISSETSKIS